MTKLRPQSPFARVLSYMIPIGLIVVAWAMTTPSFAGPDEAAQYIKALGTVSADPIGHPATWDEPTQPETKTQLAYFHVTSRRFPISSPLAPRMPTVPCFSYRPHRSAACATAHPPSGPVEQISYVGIYQPLYYVLPGLAAHLASTPDGGLRAARLASALQFLVLLGVAFAILERRGHGPPPLGVLLVLTPMTLSLGGTLSSSGFEIATAILFTVAITQLAIEPTVEARLLLLVVLAGVLVCWSRPLGPAWAAAAIVVAALLGGWKRIRLVGADRRVWAAAAVVAVVGAVGSAAWDLALGQGDRTGRPPLPTAVHELANNLTQMVEQQIGYFGYLDANLPREAYVIGAALVVSALVFGFVVGTRRVRLALVVGALFYLVIAVGLFYAATGTGFDVQGRYLLPAWAVLAGTVDVAVRERGWLTFRSVTRRVMAAWVVLLALLDVGAVYADGRRFAVGQGAGESLLFFLHPAWSPPGGWSLWLVVAAVGGLGLVATIADQLVAPAAYLGTDLSQDRRGSASADSGRSQRPA